MKLVRHPFKAANSFISLTVMSAAISTSILSALVSPLMGGAHVTRAGWLNIGALVVIVVSGIVAHHAQYQLATTPLISISPD